MNIAAIVFILFLLFTCCNTTKKKRSKFHSRYTIEGVRVDRLGEDENYGTGWMDSATYRRIYDSTWWTDGDSVIIHKIKYKK